MISEVTLFYGIWISILFFHLRALYIIIIIITLTSLADFVCRDGNEGSAFSLIDRSDVGLVQMCTHKC